MPEIVESTRVFFFFHVILKQTYEVDTTFLFVCLIFMVQRKERA